MKRSSVLSLALALIAGAASAELLNHWKLDDTYIDGSDTLTSNSAGAVPGKLHSQVAYNATGGASGGFMHFNGGPQNKVGTADSRIEIATSALNGLIGSGAVTVSFWIRITEVEFLANGGLNRFCPFWPVGSGTSLGGYCPLRDTIRRVYFNAGDPDSGGLLISDWLNRFDFGSDGAWDHYAMTADDTAGDMIVYLNGVPFTSATGQSVSLPASYKYFNLGARQNDTGGAGEFEYQSELELDDVQVYNEALTGDQVAWLTANPGKAIGPPPGSVVVLK